MEPLRLRPLVIPWTLDHDDVYWGATVGIQRNVLSIKQKQEHWPPLTVSSYQWMNHVEGAIAELVVARWLGVEWAATVNTFRKGFDVSNYQVRWSSKGVGAGELVVRPRDKDAQLFISVRGTAPDYELLGWMRGADAKQEKWKSNPQNRGEAWFVHQDLLKDLGDLPDE